MTKVLYLLILIIFGPHIWLTAKPIHITVVIPSYNNEQWCYKNLSSIAKQSYNHWNAIYINDHSTDKTGSIVNEFVRLHNLQNKFTVIHNKNRIGSLKNIYNVVSKINPLHVVVLVDGDDWLSDSNALKYIARLYKKDCRIWLTYGNFIRFPSNLPSHCKKYPKHIIKNCEFRTYQFIASHLRSFYAGLFHLIKEEDLKDEKGKFFPSAGDTAYMLPMLEMASLKHFRFVPKVLYTYNQNNPLNDHLNKPLQDLCYNKIIAKPKYKPLTHAPWKDSLIIPLLLRNKKVD